MKDFSKTYYTRFGNNIVACRFEKIAINNISSDYKSLFTSEERRLEVDELREYDDGDKWAKEYELDVELGAKLEYRSHDNILHFAQDSRLDIKIVYANGKKYRKRRIPVLDWMLFYKGDDNVMHHIFYDNVDDAKKCKHQWTLSSELKYMDNQFFGEAMGDMHFDDVTTLYIWDGSKPEKVKLNADIDYINRTLKLLGKSKIYYSENDCLRHHCGNIIEFQEC